MTDSKDAQAGEFEANKTSYADLLWFAARHLSRGTLKDLELNAAERVPEHEGRSAEENAKTLANDLERMGATFIKGAQLLSSRSEWLPEAYREALSRLQDQVRPIPFEEIKRIIESDLHAPINKLFESFSEEAIASASLSQIHTAVLKSGKKVAVKVQRPGLREQIENDFKLIRPLVALFCAKQEDGGSHIRELLDDTYELLLQELDFSMERENMLVLHKRVEKSSCLVTPLPVVDYCRGRVLTMSYLPGTKVTDVSVLRLQEIDGAKLLDELYGCYLYQILMDGVFHADPHPGNILLTDDGRIGLIDMGMVCRVSVAKRRDLTALFMALAQADTDRAKESILSLCSKQLSSNQEKFLDQIEQLILKHHGRAVDDINIGDTMLQIGEIARTNGFSPPRELNFIAKVTVNLERVASSLDPSFNPAEATGRHVSSILQKQLFEALKPSDLLQQAVEVKQLATKLPHRMNQLLDSIGNGPPKFELDVFDEHFLMYGIQKIANRITLGLVVAALIMAAAQLAAIDSRYALFGYPVIAVALFAIAILIGGTLVYSILRHDISRERSKKEGESQ